MKADPAARAAPKEAAEAVVAELADLGVATVYEAAGRIGLVDVELTRLTPGSRTAGPARIAACGQDDNRAVHEVMAAAQPGDVLVLTMPEPAPVALLGELLATQAVRRGTAAVLVNAAVRDADELAEMDVPVWTRFIRAAGATKDHRGAVDVPVVVGGATINPGDMVVLDGDGAVVVERDRVADVLAASRERASRETTMRARYEAGELSYHISGMRAQDQEQGSG